MVKLWICMAGPAGAGKSTLADSLAEDLRRRGRSVDAFGEEELFERPAFAAVARAFRSKEQPDPALFEDAYRAWLRGLPDGQIAVMDWAPSGMSGDLAWALSDRSAYLRHLRAVATLAGGRVILLQLRTPVSVAVERAAEQRGEEWLARYDRIARADGSRHPDRLDRIKAWAGDHDARTDLEIEAASEAGWPVHCIDAARPPQEVLVQALAVIDGTLAR